MNFHKSALAKAALAMTLLATGASASAVILGAGVNNISPAEDNTELLFIAYSPSLEASYVLDLGISIGTLKTNGNSPAGFTFTRGMTSAFTGSNLATATDLQWAIAGFDTYTATDALQSGDLQLVTTVSSTSSFTPAAPGLTGGGLFAATPAWQEYTNRVNNTAGHVAPTVNGSSYNVKADGAAYLLDDFATKTNLSGNFPAGQFNAKGTSSKLYYMTACAAADCLFFGDLNVLVNTFGNLDGAAQVSFDGSNVAFALAPIPEPGTYAMLALGLLAVGAKVRRRQQG